MSPDDYCRQRAGARGSSLYYSFLFLGSGRRAAATALYAYCRELQDAVDKTHDSGVAEVQLDWWQGEIGRLFAGAPQHPVTRALAPHLAAYAIGREALLQVLEGVRQELRATRLLDAAALVRHGHLVAGVPAAAATAIFGGDPAATRAYAHHLGLALRLVAIVRDLGEDARRGRLYLPLDDLQRCQVKAADLLAGRYVEGFAPLMALQAARARHAFADALAALPPAERRTQRPGLILGALHAALLDEIERDGFQVLHQRTSLTPLRKFGIAWRTWVFGPPSALGRRRTGTIAPPSRQRCP